MDQSTHAWLAVEAFRTIDQCAHTDAGKKRKLDKLAALLGQHLKDVVVAAWLPAVTPFVYLRSWPRRNAIFSIDWLYGVKVGAPVFIAPQLPGVKDRVSDTYKHFPDASVNLSVLAYFLEVRIEMGWALFMAYNGFTGGSTNPKENWSLQRGGKVGLSANYTF